VQFVVGNISGVEFRIFEQKCNNKNRLRRDLHSANGLELVEIGRVSVANWRKLAKTG
jgi:hypothetical protein